MDAVINKTKLNNGLTVVSEHISSVKSISIGIWVKSGARHETDQQAGVTHFLEHMLFKGTKNRTAYEIAQSMESVGGYLNAFTSTEYTCYYARCLDTELERALDVLSDMVMSPIFPTEEIEKEKKVVIEEMKMYRDSPDDYLFEEFTSHLFQKHPLGRPILGFEETVNSFTDEHLFEYMRLRYAPENLIVAVAGNVDHNAVVTFCENLFNDHDRSLQTQAFPDVPLLDTRPLNLHKSIEQTHYILGRRGLHFDDQQKYVMLLVNTLLGGGMSSRLHQNVREKYGYCYSIQTFNQSFTETGIWGVYVGTDKEYVSHVHELIVEQLQDLAQNMVSLQELEEAKTQLKGKMLLSQENTSNRMMRLAKSEIYYQRHVDLDELVAHIEEVSAEDIRSFSVDFMDQSHYVEATLTPK
jgi:predicted Zn-dependent peptidase